jgi:hypothetical protein
MWKFQRSLCFFTRATGSNRIWLWLLRGESSNAFAFDGSNVSASVLKCFPRSSKICQDCILSIIFEHNKCCDQPLAKHVHVHTCHTLPISNPNVLFLRILPDSETSCSGAKKQGTVETAIGKSKQVSTNALLSWPGAQMLLQNCQRHSTKTKQRFHTTLLCNTICVRAATKKIRWDLVNTVFLLRNWICPPSRPSIVHLQNLLDDILVKGQKHSHRKRVRAKNFQHHTKPHDQWIFLQRIWPLNEMKTKNVTNTQQKNISERTEQRFAMNYCFTFSPLRNSVALSVFTLGIKSR